MTKTALRTCGLLTVVLGGAALMGAGCASRTQAEMRVPAPEPLHVPVVPPRAMVMPPPPPSSLPASTVNVTEASPSADEEAPEASAPEPRAREAPPKPATPRPDAEAADEEAEAPSVLRTPEAVDDEAMGRRIRDRLRRANAGLSSLDPSALNDDAQNLYQNAVGHIKQAEAFLEQGRLRQADLSAEKALELAERLTR